MCCSVLQCVDVQVLRWIIRLLRVRTVARRYMRWCFSAVRNLLWLLVTRYCNITHCNTLQHTATQCNTGDSVMQHNSMHAACMHYNTLQHTSTHDNMLQQAATHFSTLKHIASCCNKLQHTATHRGYMRWCFRALRNLLWLLVTRYCNTTLCNTLQHARTATHCNTLDKLH